MKWFRFVWRNATRSRRRSILMILSLATTFFLFCTLQTMLTALDSVTSFNTAQHRVVVTSRLSQIGTLPQAYEEQIRSLAGVAEVCGMTNFSGLYKDDHPDNFFAQYAVNARTVFDVFPELDVDETQRGAFLANPQSCLVHESLIERFSGDGWKLGSTVPLIGARYPVDPKLSIAGVFTAPAYEDVLIFHWESLDASLTAFSEYELFFAKAQDSAAMPRIIDEIDSRYLNSEYPTASMTEDIFQESTNESLATQRTVLQRLSMVLLVVMVLAGANAIALATRERVREISVLRTLGFTPGRVRVLVIAEACLLSLLGGALGCGGAWLLWEQAGPPSFLFLNFHVTAGTLLTGLALSVLVGVASGSVPAHRVATLPIVSGLRKVT